MPKKDNTQSRRSKKLQAKKRSRDKTVYSNKHVRAIEARNLKNTSKKITN